MKNDLLKIYKKDKSVKHIIFVKYIKGSKATLELYEKKEDKWKRKIKTNAYIGKNGIGKEKEGDNKTPIGIFQIKGAFGIKENPGTKIKYIRVTEDLYSCGSNNKYYNKIVSLKNKDFIPTKNDEHLIEYKPQYNYAIIIDYNSKCIYGKGSSIFLHCKGRNKYTAGCIAISEKNMRFVLKSCDNNTKIIIY